MYKNTILGRLIEFNFQQFVITSIGKSLDVVLCNNPALNNDVGFDFAKTGKYDIDGKLFPDHIAVYSNLNLQVATYKRPVPPRRNLDFSIFSLSKVNWNCLNSAIMLEPFQPFCFSNVEVLIESWYKWLYDIFERNVPRKTKHRRSLPPWASPSASHLIRSCKAMRRNLRKRRSLAKTIKLKKIEKTLKQQPSEEQRAFETKIFSGRKFSEIQKYLKAIRRNDGWPSNMKWGNNLAECPEEMAELLNK